MEVPSHASPESVPGRGDRGEQGHKLEPEAEG